MQLANSGRRLFAGRYFDSRQALARQWESLKTDKSNQSNQSNQSNFQKMYINQLLILDWFGFHKNN